MILLGAEAQFKKVKGNGLYQDGDRYHQMVNTEIRLIIFFAAKDGEALYKSAKTTLGADCGSNQFSSVQSLSRV